MKQLFKRLVFLKLLLLSTHSIAQINSGDFAKIIGQEPNVEINLGAAMLGLLSSAIDKEEQGISQILSSLKGINVMVFDLNNLKDTQSIRTEIKKLSKQKIDSGFEKLASIKEEDSLVQIFAKMDDNKFTNLSIFALDDDDELVLIDIKGSILISQIGELMNHFDVDLDINSLK